MPLYSQKFTNYYDVLMGDYSILLRAIKKLISTSAPRKDTIRLLELGCGTGTILQNLPTSYKLYGLDISKDMLKIAKKKVSYATYIHADMTNFSLDEKFDIILCVFDSINHLTKFSQWKKVFRLAAKHLSPNGVFIFDMNTTKRLSTLATFKPYVKRLDTHTIVWEKFYSQGKNIYNLQIDFLKNAEDNTIELFEENVQEAAFDTEKVIAALQKYFTIEKMIDPIRKKAIKKTGRIFFSCKKLS